MITSPESNIEDTFATAILTFAASTNTEPNPQARGARISGTVCGNVEKATIAEIQQGVKQLIKTESRFYSCSPSKPCHAAVVMFTIL